jgi:uncharacterized protein YjbI with pentapeptide repeats
MWVAYLPERDFLVSATQITAFGTSMLWAQLSLWLMTRTLRDGSPEGNVLAAPFRDSPMRAAVVTALLFGFIGLISYISYGTVERRDWARNVYRWACPATGECIEWKRILSRFLLADFTGVDASKNGRTIDLEGRDLRYAFASGVNFTGADLSLAIMNGIDLHNSVLQKAKLPGAALGSAALGGADLSDAKLSNACLIGANAVGATFRGAHLFGAYLSAATLASTDFTGADLRSAHLGPIDSTTDDCPGLTDAELPDAKARTDFTDSILTGADLRGTDLQGISLTSDQLKSACLDCTTTLPDGTHPKTTSKSCPSTTSNQ